MESFITGVGTWIAYLLSDQPTARYSNNVVPFSWSSMIKLDVSQWLLSPEDTIFHMVIVFNSTSDHNCLQKGQCMQLACPHSGQPITGVEHLNICKYIAYVWLTNGKLDWVRRFCKCWWNQQCRLIDFQIESPYWQVWCSPVCLWQLMVASINLFFDTIF